MTDDPLAIGKSIVVPLRPAEAFRLFTERLGTWWPVESHSLSAGRGAVPREVVVEPREGGRILETRDDGGVAPWGRITAWAPGARLTIAWHVGRDEAEATEVDIRFTAVDTGTRVDLVHTGFAGAGAATMAENYRTGWDFVLGRYVSAAGVRFGVGAGH